MKLKLSYFFSLFVPILSSLFIGTLANNDYPIILVHGLCGWGREEMLGFKYFGGVHGDFQEKLKQQGHRVFTAAVGPFSSNWDRACELYAQIKGGIVDYGAEHSKHHKHSRFGTKKYPGLYPEWGTKDSNGNTRKIHLIGHSMGGQTIRMLSQLLASGTKGAPYKEDASSSLLFQGGHGDWIHSITTISTPHQGSVIADGFAVVGNIFKDIVLGMVGVAGAAGGITTDIYDFKLGQWNITSRQNGESITQYVTRIFSSSVFNPGFQDIALYDITLQGSKELNNWVVTQPNIYYFSYSTSDTSSSKTLYNWQIIPIHIANILTMVFPMHLGANFIGGPYTTFDKGLDTSWQENDGCVAKLSQYGPGNSNNVPYQDSSKLKNGVWQRMQHIDRTDHLTICGMGILKNPWSVYTSHANLLKSLPLTTSKKIVSNESSLRLADRDIEIAISKLGKQDSDTKSPETIKELCDQLVDEVSRRMCYYLNGLNYP